MRWNLISEIWIFSKRKAEQALRTVFRKRKKPALLLPVGMLIKTSNKEPLQKG